MERVDHPVAKKLSFGSDDFDPSKYQAVAQSARLVEMGLIRQNYEAKLASFWGADQSKERLAYGFSGRPKGCSLDQESGTLVGGYEWEAEVKDGKKKALKLKAEYVVVYRVLSEVEPEYARLYFEKLARFTTYPYFRALFAMNTSNSSLALDPLPSLIDRVD